MRMVDIGGVTTIATGTIAFIVAGIVMATVDGIADNGAI
jgi:hypothetical protein